MYTTLRVVEAGVLLLAQHRRRFAGDPVARRAFDDFVRQAEPGIYSLTFADGALKSERRERSSLSDGMPVRYLASPLHAPIAKDPRPYTSLRVSGTATLLTDPAGEELWESCAAALIGWRDGRYLLVPEDRPKVRSSAEAAIRAGLSCLEEPLRVRDLAVPLLLVNAVKPTAEPRIEGRPRFPTAARTELEAFLWRTAERPGGAS